MPPRSTTAAATTTEPFFVSTRPCPCVVVIKVHAPPRVTKHNARELNIFIVPYGERWGAGGVKGLEWAGAVHTYPR